MTIGSGKEESGPRCVALVGPYLSGKTTLLESILSLTGATMLVIYFAWRKDVVGILGQATGWLIYVRNLWLIYKHKPPFPNA